MGNILLTNKIEKPSPAEDPPIKYMVVVMLDIIFALVLGILTNWAVNYITKTFGLDFYAGLFIQIILVTVVIYGMRSWGSYIHQEPRESYSYDVIFIALYISSQHNFQELLRRFSNNHYDF